MTANRIFTSRIQPFLPKLKMRLQEREGHLEAQRAGKDGIEVKYIADVYTGFSEKFGLPRQSGIVPELTGRIVFRPEFRNPDAIREIEKFTHLWILFDFSLAHRDEWSPTVRPPRLGGNRRVGVFASRSPFRPNPIGLSCVKLEKVSETENEGKVLIVSGIDVVSGTPVIDIKPYLPISDCRPDAVGGYSDEMAGYELNVEFAPGVYEKVPEKDREAVTGCIKSDPRPSYHDDPERVYGMVYNGLEIKFKVSEGTAYVLSAEETDNDS